MLFLLALAHPLVALPMQGLADCGLALTGVVVIRAP